MNDFECVPARDCWLVGWALDGHIIKFDELAMLGVVWPAFVVPRVHIEGGRTFRVCAPQTVERLCALVVLEPMSTKPPHLLAMARRVVGSVEKK